MPKNKMSPTLEEVLSETDLLQCLVVDKAGGILGYLKLALLDLLAKLPVACSVKV